ncbi:MAG: shikimate kinase AroL [Deltaproteobacteria bacterium]|nr:shikimate kinase AroL [Deltaproteobacteria bacterium]
MGTSSYLPNDQFSSPSTLEGQPNLVLIGYRATGKTAVGRRLAVLLNRPFVDLDQVLVEEAGQTIAEIVAQRGWEEFRRREKELVGRYGLRQGLVLATGGGVVLDLDNIRILRKNGIVIWLTADPATIQGRLIFDPGEESRPSLTGKDLISEVREVLKARQHLYLAAAQIIINTVDQTVEEVTERVLAAVKAREALSHGG